MADDSSGEKSQEPTQHRRQQAREQGQVAKSQDLAAAAILVVGTGLLLYTGSGLAEFLIRYFKLQLGGDAWLSTDLASATAHCTGLCSELGKVVMPIFGALLLAAIGVNLGQVGFLFLPERIGLDISRLDPLAGLGRLFAMANFVRLGFGILKLLLIATVAAVCLYKEIPVILGLPATDVLQIATYLAHVMLWTTLKIAVAMLILSILDYGFQWWRQEQDLKMTTQELREEMKNLEGNPQVISRRKQVQRQLAMRRMSTAVPKADVVVTNPTELAVAIQYDPKTMAAPIVVAKGAGSVAKRIRQLALENNIPVVEKKPLAQALYRDVEVNQPIPADQYAAVAEILAYVYQLKNKKMPNRPAA